MASYKGSMRWGVPESCVRCFGQMCLMTSDDEAPSCLSISGKGVYCFAQDSSFRVGYKHKSIVLYPQHPSRYHSPGIGERTSTSTLSVPFDTQSSSLMNYSPALSDSPDGMDPGFSGRLDGGPPTSPTQPVKLSPRKALRQRRYSDRFIPSRSGSDAAHNFSIITTTQESSDESSEANRKPYSRLLRTEMGFEMHSDQMAEEISGSSPNSNSRSSSHPIPVSSSNPRQRNLLRFVSPAPVTNALESTLSLSPMSKVGQDYISTQSRHLRRKIPSRPYVILEAPGIVEDFYLNILDWSAANQIAVGLSSAVYLYSVSGGKVIKFMEAPVGETVSAVSWHAGGSLLAVGLSSGEIQVWDAGRHAMLRSFPQHSHRSLENDSSLLTTTVGHRTRVGVISWQGTGNYTTEQFSSGSRDRSVLHHDLRDPSTVVAKFGSHKQEVCGLRWSPDGTRLASGGNDNKLLIWNLSQPRQPERRLTEHRAAVKAIAWSPHSRGMLVSGGGTADRSLRVWNVISGNGSSQQAVDTGSQVCNVVWSKNSNEIASTHGYSQNHIAVWSYPFASPLFHQANESSSEPLAGVAPLATLVGHSMRVLYLAMSPDGQSVVTGAGDESLRFWNIFPPSKSDLSDGSSTISTKSKIDIR